VAASLNRDFNIPTFAIRARTTTPYYGAPEAALEHKPQFTMDDGCDLVTMLLTKRKDLVPNLIAGTEETTTGVIRLRAMAKDGTLKYPIIAVNDAMTKHFFDKPLRHGPVHAGWRDPGDERVARGPESGHRRPTAGAGAALPMRAKGHGSDVIITEIDPVKGIEAVMDGFRVNANGRGGQAGRHLHYRHRK